MNDYPKTGQELLDLPQAPFPPNDPECFFMADDLVMFARDQTGQAWGVMVDDGKWYKRRMHL